MFDDNLVPIALFLTLAFTVVSVTRIISESRTRRQMIQAGTPPEQAQAILTPPRRDPALYSALKWGLVIGAAGLALVVIQFLPYQADEPIVYGLILLFTGAGLLTYYTAARRLA